MLEKNERRNKMCIISCRHKGVANLIYWLSRTQNIVGLGGVLKQMKKQKRDTNLKL
jgi:hypothetical protein